MKWIDSQRLCVLDLSELLGNSVVYVGGTGIVQGILASFLVISSLEEHTAPSLLASHNEMRIRAHLLTELKTQLEWGSIQAADANIAQMGMLHKGKENCIGGTWNQN